jgi:hypothetical protein
VRDETGAVSNLRQNEYGDLYDPTGTSGGIAMPSPQPASPPGPPSSSGDIDFTAGLAGTPPPATADQFRTNGVVPTSEELEARNPGHHLVLLRQGLCMITM